MEKTKLSYDPNDLAVAYNLQVNKSCDHLNSWLSASYTFNDFENAFFDKIYSNAHIDAAYWNEEELKIKMVGLLFSLADIEVAEKAKVFYERPLAEKVGNYNLAVICDCLVAAPLPFNKPQKPYFFLQEFKKKRGEKNDPEGQLLTAMLIAQAQNNDEKPIYGGYLFGSVWSFATLLDNQYCVSREYNATHRNDLLKIVYILRKLKEIIMNR
jgi:hypothetical protein